MLNSYSYPPVFSYSSYWCLLQCFQVTILLLQCHVFLITSVSWVQAMAVLMMGATCQVPWATAQTCGRSSVRGYYRLFLFGLMRAEGGV